jgi:hypothetical protein
MHVRLMSQGALPFDALQKRSERGSEFGDEQRRLFPRREMTALVKFSMIDPGHQVGEHLVESVSSDPIPIVRIRAQFDAWRISIHICPSRHRLAFPCNNSVASKPPAVQFSANSTNWIFALAAGQRRRIYV